jgi:hypothetical protein
MKGHLNRGDVVVMPYADAYASGSDEDAEPVSITTLLRLRRGASSRRSITAVT